MAHAACWRSSLRVALLTVLEPATADGGQLRALLPVSGAPVVRHQLALALAMEAQRILCIARVLTPDIIALQHQAEKAGARFQVVTGAHQVAALVTANDDLLVIADGLLVDPAEAAGLLAPSHAVLVQPVESGLALGFERIDINHASAGLMRVPGRLAARLTELPADCDTGSALLRIALQSGIVQVPVPVELRDGPAWKLVRDEHEAHLLESRWIDRLLGRGRGMAPGFAISRQVVRSFGGALLQSGSRETALAAISALVLALGMTMAWFGHAGAAFVLLAFSWLGRRTATLVGTIARQAAGELMPAVSRGKVFGVLLDGALVAAVAWQGTAALPWWERAYAPAVLVGVLRAFRRFFGPKWRPWLEDRFLLCLALALAGALGLLGPAVMLLGLGAIAAGVFMRRDAGGHAALATEG